MIHCHATLNLHHGLTCCNMLHFVTSFMNQNKRGKQSLESRKYLLLIIVKPHLLMLYHGLCQISTLILYTDVIVFNLL